MSLRKSSAALKVLGIWIMFSPTIVLAQAQLRIIDKTTWRSEPIRIQKLKTDGRVIELGKRFSAESEWLNDLTVTVENVSSKAIARIELNLSFPRAKSVSSEVPTYVVRLIYGLDPSDPSYSETQKPALPGDCVDLQLPEANLPMIRADLKTLGYPENISHAQISIDSVIFLDGSTWAGDEMLFPDPKNPARKINPKLQRPNSTPNLSILYKKALRAEEPGSIFQNASFTFTSPLDFYNPHFLLRSLLILQDEQLPCNTVFVTTQDVSCGTDGSGCTFKKNIFDGSIELLGLRNARSELSSVRCQKSDGTFCNDTLISNFARLPCGVRVAGSCAASADWNTYPSTGCITGLIFGGPCTRSSAFQSRCASPTGYDSDFCNCPDGIDTSPIAIDIDGSGFSMTDAIGGVVLTSLGIVCLCNCRGQRRARLMRF
ncbi:MAG TPA: hypothetical protein VJW17_02920 [Pyrinomonadaceae bacterium]|nr:hypothetical protein [Pyrinomonadaceae bacterium]